MNIKPKDGEIRFATEKWIEGGIDARRRVIARYSAKANRWCHFGGSWVFGTLSEFSVPVTDPGIEIPAKPAKRKARR